MEEEGEWSEVRGEVERGEGEGGRGVRGEG